MEDIHRTRKTVLAAAVVVLLLAGVLMVSLQIRTITVTGNQRYTEEQMIENVFPDRLSYNAVYCYLKDRFQPHEKIPFVEDYSIVFKSPLSVEIIVYEKSVVGYVSCMSSCMYFDKDGIVVESTNEQLEGIPQITGLRFGQIVLYQKLPVEQADIFQEILNLTQILSVYEMKVDRIQYSSFGEATLYMDGIEVQLGGNENLNGKIAELNDMLPILSGRSGVLYLEDYDETNTTASYSFVPKERH